MNQKLKLEPTENRVIIKQDDKPKEQMKGKIVLPDANKTAPAFGTILAVGPGRKREDGSRTRMTLQVGWRVAFPEYGGTRITVDEVEYVIFGEPEIIAVFVNTETE